MFCKNCGSELPDDAVFCSKCGTQLNEKTSSNIMTKKILPVGVVIIVASVLSLGIIIATKQSAHDAPMSLNVIAKTRDTSVEIAAGSLSKTLQCDKVSPYSLGTYSAYYLEDCSDNVNAYVISEESDIYSISGKCSDKTNCSEKALLVLRKHEIGKEIMRAADGIKKQVELCIFDTFEGQHKPYAQIPVPSCKNGNSGAGWRISSSTDYSTKYVNKIEVANGVITLTANTNDLLNGESLSLFPTFGEYDNGVVDWIPGDGVAHGNHPALGSPTLHSCKDSGLC